MTSKSWAFSSCGKGILAEGMDFARKFISGYCENIAITVAWLCGVLLDIMIF